MSTLYNVMNDLECAHYNTQGMGFRSEVSEVALKEYKTVQAAIDAILAGKGELAWPTTVDSIAFSLLLPV